MMTDRVKYLEQCMNDLNVKLTEKQVDQFMRYYEILVEWNSFMNLTGITEFEEVVVKHFVDSVSLVKMVDLSKEYSVMDIGTGAGFPGIPLKVIFPNLKITLLDSLNKRIKFLDHVIEELGLTNIETLHGRAEDYAKDTSYREQFDFVVSRAVSNLSTLSEYCLPYCKVGGSFISYKSEKIEEESTSAKKAIHLLGGKFQEQVEFTLPYSNNYRNLYCIKKIEKTANKYPRKAGLPSKEPL